MNTLAILIACGREEEIAPGVEAAFLSLGNAPMMTHTLKTMQQSTAIDGIIIAVSKSRVGSALHLIKRFGCTKVRGVVVGSVNRLSTLRTVIAKLPEPASVIVVHEASRPFISPEVIEETIKAAKRYGCSIAAHKLPDAVKVAPKGLKASLTLARNTAWVAQTPQAYKSNVLEKIIDAESMNTKMFDDESEFVQKPAEVHMIESGIVNMKIRTSDDLAIATALLNAKLT